MAQTLTDADIDKLSAGPKTLTDADIDKQSAAPAAPATAAPQQSTLQRAASNFIPSAINSVKKTLLGPSMGDGGQWQPSAENPNLPQRFPGRMGNILHSAPLIEHPYEYAKEAFASDPVGALQAPIAAVQGAAGLIPDVGAAASKAFTVDPRIAVTRALRPTPSNPDFPEQIPQTLNAIKAANPGYKPGIENGQLNLGPAADRAIKMHQEALEPWLQRAAGQRFSGQPIIDATRRATSEMLPSESQSGQSLMDRAHADYGTDFEPQELRDRLALLNQRMQPFYNKSPNAQSSALADIPESVLKAQRDATADTLYRGLDPENEGAGPRLIQSRTGNLIDLRDAAARRNNAIVAEQPLTPFGKVVDPIKGMIRHLMPGKASGLAFSEGSEGRSLPMLRRAFNAADETEGANELGMLPRPRPRSLPAPGDTSGPIPAAARDFAAADPMAYASRTPRLLGPATSPVGTNGVIVPDLAGAMERDARAMNAGPRQLGPASSPIGVSGTIVPDIVGRSSRGNGGSQKLLPAPASGQPPTNVLPTGPGAIGPAANSNAYGPDVARPLPGQRGGRLIDILKSLRDQE